MAHQTKISDFVGKLPDRSSNMPKGTGVSDSIIIIDSDGEEDSIVESREEVQEEATCHSVGISGGNACVNIGDDVIVEDETVEEESESINAASNSGDLVTEGTDITTACDNHACSDHASYPACTCVGCSDFNKPNQQWRSQDLKMLGHSTS